MDPFDHELYERYGLPIPEAEKKKQQLQEDVSREYPKTSKSKLCFEKFSIVEVTGDDTCRVKGTMLIVCEQSETHYWVWASKRITGIKKSVCDVIHKNLDIDDALIKMGKSPFFTNPNPKKQDFLRRAGLVYDDELIETY